MNRKPHSSHVLSAVTEKLCCTQPLETSESLWQSWSLIDLRPAAVSLRLTVTKLALRVLPCKLLQWNMVKSTHDQSKTNKSQHIHLFKFSTLSQLIKMYQMPGLERIFFQYQMIFVCSVQLFVVCRARHWGWGFGAEQHICFSITYRQLY